MYGTYVVGRYLKYECITNWKETMKTNIAIILMINKRLE